MIRWLFALCLMACPAVAEQDGWPALYDVANVEADDVLNIRSEPNASATIIGTLEHDDNLIEVTRTNETGTWGQINSGEGTGWVSMKFLSRRPGQSDGGFPQFAFCHGTEPFWSLSRSNGHIRFERAGEPPIESRISLETVSSNHRHRYSFRADQMVGVVSRQYCDDGMSDIENGLELNLILVDQPQHYQGCCTLAPR